MRTSVLVFCLALLLVGTAPAYDSLNVRLIGYREMSNIARGIDVGGDYACVANYSAGLRVMSVADPTSPFEVGHYDNPGISLCVAIIDTDCVYLPDSGSGVHVISIADPAHPAEVGFLNTPSHVNGIAAAGQYAYVAEGEDLLVVSVVDPVNPVIIARCDSSGAENDVAVSGDYAYAVDSNRGLRVISVADAAHPFEVGRCDLTDARSVAVSGGYACVGGYRRVSVISVSDPANPTNVGSYAFREALRDVEMDGGIVYAAVDADGLRVVSIEDPAHPLEVGHYKEIGQACGVSLAGGYIFVADGGAGLLILQYYGAGVQETMNDERVSMNVGPTIVRGVLRMGDRGQKTGDRVELLDVSGRKVLGLKPGANDVRALSPGVYFVREAQSQAHAQTVRKVVVQR